MELQKGRPADTAGRMEKEIRTYDFLDGLGVEYDRVDHGPAMTMEDCKEADEILQATICKNLFLCNRFRKVVFCKPGIYGRIPGHYAGFCQCHGTDE